MPINDITPRDRSIRNIPVPGGARREAPPLQTPPTRSVPPRPTLPPKRRSKLWIWVLIVVILCGAGGVLLSTVFAHATVTITPKTLSPQTPVALTAVPSGGSGLAYQTLSVSNTASTSVAANGTQRVSRAATGSVTIYNNYSTAPQQLVATTRLVTANGSVYHIKNTVTVPGATKKSDGTLQASSVVAAIYADKPGPLYNTTGSIALNILGFKGDPRYTKFPVQTQGALAGGFIGDEPAVAPADLANAQTLLKRQLDDSIRSTATTQVPEGSIAVNGSLGIVYTSITQTPGPNNTVSLSQGGTATLAMVQGSELAKALAKQAFPTYAGEPVLLEDASSVTVSLDQSHGSSTPSLLRLAITGAPKVVWQFDEQALAQALMGKPKSQFQSIVNNYEPAIQTAVLTLRPFWESTLPTDASKLTISVSK